jgi:hypothetical protein
LKQQGLLSLQEVKAFFDLVERQQAQLSIVGLFDLLEQATAGPAVLRVFCSHIATN